MTILAPIEADAREAEIIAAALDALYVGRDNKALLVARAGTIVSINCIAAQLCGSSPEALIGQGIIAQILEAPDAPANQAAAQTQRWETVLKTVGNVLIPVEVVREALGSRIPGAYVYAIRDLRERREAAAERERNIQALQDSERQLRIQNVRFDTAINNMPQGLAMFDAEGLLQVCNGRFVELLGVAAELARPGCTLAALLNEAPFDTAGRDSLLPSNVGQESSTVLVRTDGVLLLANRRPMVDGGIVLTTEDITAREQTKRQLEEYTVRLEQSNTELQNFAYVASHDLQEPLRKIETFANRVIRQTEGKVPIETAHSLERIQNSSQRMRRLIDALLSYARLGNETRAFAVVNLGEVLAGVLSDMQIRIEETRAQIRFGTLPTITGDPIQLRQLLQNLISNSLKFTRKGVDPVIEIAACIRPCAAQGDQQLVLTLTDNGIGFENKFKDQIFAIFKRLHARTDYEGTGVGLATCRKIVDRHNGHIDAEGRPGDGATFTITLPIAPTVPHA